MELVRTSEPVTKIAADAVVVGLYAQEPPAGPAAEVDAATGKTISRLIEAQEIAGKKLELLPLHAPTGLAARQVLVVGLGERAKLDCGAAYRAAAAAARHLAAKPRARVACYLGHGWTAEQVESGACGALVGCHGQDTHRAEKKCHPFATLLWAGADEAVLARSRIIAESIQFTRALVDGPSAEVYPETFAARTAAMAGECGLACEVWDQDRLAEERCGALLAVNQGSSRPARLVKLRHDGGPAGQAPLAIVGKGVTFDSGGLSLKPTDSMLTMKCDKAGAATMVGAMRAIALLKLPLNVVGLCGLVENMTGPAAMKLGDVLVARSGRTIEIHNTDAEGRLVLADVLNVALDSRPDRIVDLATLTGACVVALGTEVAGLMTNDQAWCDRVAAAARAVGEPVWQLPMDGEIYDELIKSDVADIKNVGEGRWGGAITAAKFLEQFVGQVPWTHIDIAGPAFREKPKPWADAGASGQYVRTLVELARRG